MNKKALTYIMLAVCAFCCTGKEIKFDLPVNGDFYGESSGDSPVPGWVLSADGGQAAVYPTIKPEEFILELKALPGRSQSALSNLYQIPRKLVKLNFELRLQGSGCASYGYEAFDQSRRKVVASESWKTVLTQKSQSIEKTIRLPDGAKFIRIRLTAEPGSAAGFFDVDVEAVVSVSEADMAAWKNHPAIRTIAAPVPRNTAK